MKNNFFEIRCAINHGEQMSIRVPFSCHEDFTRTVSGRREKDMAKLVELFGEYSELDSVKKKTFQALIEERANDVATLDDLLVLLKAVRLCTAFMPKE